MDIDLTSILIGITALSTFFIPIGMHQFSQWRKQSKTRNVFENAARNYGLKFDTSEILRDGTAIGIDIPNRMFLHLKSGNDTLIGLDDIQSCSFYKHQQKKRADDGSESQILIIGIQIVLKKSQTRKLNLPIFEGKEGFTFGDEERVTERWIKNIRSNLTAEEVVVEV
ncbi:hypothetical protein DYD21_18300 [Rhodohalobacter sp. SW132]|uniref:hypothetical protein n=1 Tax=Rhodohalobacter sp. SW132 TaxID=2293433 RepID=UPI000E286453|nr:hypothetical protein [Rhodohalobacter sp. SW132]REL24540.1 hypothetical protein DYD21_18300 [Rhodohalobacter sp. SW132]